MSLCMQESDMGYNTFLIVGIIISFYCKLIFITYSPCYITTRLQPSQYNLRSNWNHFRVHTHEFTIKNIDSLYCQGIEHYVHMH